MKQPISFRSSMVIATLFALICAVTAHAGIPPVTDNGDPPTLAPVLDQVTPAVVNIAVLSRSPEDDNPMLQDPFFRRFFGLPERSRPQVAAGSGVIVDARLGHVLTNHHVIKDAKQILITLKDGRQLEAKLLGSDVGTDIALLKVAPENLTAIRFADSDALRVGDYVLAIGNPFGLGQTVTSGIVSALGRTGLNIEGYEDFIQTDASINPGNSGGALTNLRGELVGINTAIFGPTGGNIGIGFAVPSNMARAVMAQLAKFGEVRRGRIGLTTQEITPDLAKSFGLTSTQGAVVVEVAPNSPSAKAGLRPGDVVLAVNGRKVRGSADLRNQVGLMPVGEAVEFRVLRGDRQLTLKTRVESLPAAAAGAGQALAELQGATVGTVEGRGAENVVVMDVESGSPAYAHGLRAGDVIVAVNRRPVRSTQDLISALQAPGRAALSVVRGEYLFTIVLRR